MILLVPSRMLLGQFAISFLLWLGPLKEECSAFVPSPSLSSLPSSTFNEWFSSRNPPYGRMNWMGGNNNRSTLGTASRIVRLWASNDLDGRGTNEPGDDNDGDGEEGDNHRNDQNKKKGFDIEHARTQLETLVSMTDSDTGGDDQGRDKSSPTTKLERFSVKAFLSSISTNDLRVDPSSSTSIIDLPPPPPLSTMDRNRREIELALLDLLKDGDDALDELWELWYSERGPDNRSILARTDAAVSNPRFWTACEEILVALIDDTMEDGSNPHGIYFAEAVNRLATLYFLQGRFDDSYKLCRIVLQLKPWHVGALSGIVQVCIGRGERDEARLWAERRLPTVATPADASDSSGGSGGGMPSTNPRRVEWCEKAVAHARTLLQRAEQSNVERLGRPEEYYLRKAVTSKKNKTAPVSDGTDRTRTENGQNLVGMDYGNDDNNDDDDAWQ